MSGTPVALAALPGEARARLRRGPQPEWVAPMTASPGARPFSRDGWLFERMLAGERCLAFRRGAELRLLSAERARLEAACPEVVRALLAQPAHDFVADGELVAFERGRTSPERLGRLLRRGPDRAPLFYYLFDLLYLDGHDTRELPLRHRKALLRRAISSGGRLRLAGHRSTEGEAFHREACRRGWEGLIGKRADAPYRSGRSTDWLSFECLREGELVVGGYTEPGDRCAGVAALLVGYWDRGRLVYAGKVGALRDGELARRLAALERSESPFADPYLPRRGVHWVRPELVARIGFTELTAEGRLRHARFLGLARGRQLGPRLPRRPAA